MPFFSVIVPLYNKEEFIINTLNSILKQTFDDFELVIVNDGYTDESESIIKSYEDKRIRLINQTNQGEGAARNTGLANSKGKWFALIDADDLWADTHLEELVQVIKNNPDAKMVSTKSVPLNAKDIPINLHANGVSEIKTVDYFVEASKYIGVVHSSSVAIHKTVLGKVGGFSDWKAGADLEMWARIAFHFPVAISRKQTSFYLKNTGGVMDQLSVNTPRAYPEGVVTLENLSPSVRYLNSELLTLLKSDSRCKSIAIYINSRITSKCYSSYVNGYLQDFPMLTNLALEPYGAKVIFWKFVSILPVFIVKIPHSLRKILRNVYRKMKS
ncbi:Glycosyltransferase 2-like domain-containing protein [uncultured Thiomicrorhabdus sp.]